MQPTSISDFGRWTVDELLSKNDATDFQRLFMTENDSTDFLDITEQTEDCKLNEHQTVSISKFRRCCSVMCLPGNFSNLI